MWFIKNNLLKAGSQILRLVVACTSKKWCWSHSKSWPWSAVQCLSLRVLNLPVSKMGRMWRNDLAEYHWRKVHDASLVQRSVGPLILFMKNSTRALISWILKRQTDWNSKKGSINASYLGKGSRKLVQQYFLYYVQQVDLQTKLVFDKAELIAFTMSSGARHFITFCSALTCYLLFQRGKINQVLQHPVLKLMFCSGKTI